MDLLHFGDQQHVYVFCGGGLVFFYRKVKDGFSAVWGHGHVYRQDGFTVISEVCGFYRKLLLVTWPCLPATCLRFLWKFWVPYRNVKDGFSAVWGHGHVYRQDGLTVILEVSGFYRKCFWWHGHVYQQHVYGFCVCLHPKLHVVKSKMDWHHFRRHGHFYHYQQDGFRDMATFTPATCLRFLRCVFFGTCVYEQKQKMDLR